MAIDAPMADPLDPTGGAPGPAGDGDAAVAVTHAAPNQSSTFVGSVRCV